LRILTVLLFTVIFIELFYVCDDVRHARPYHTHFQQSPLQHNVEMQGDDVLVRPPVDCPVPGEYQNGQLPWSVAYTFHY